MNQRKKPIDSPKEIPSNLSDEERRDFLMEHGVSESFLENTDEAPEDERPRPRTKPINVRFDDFTLTRLKTLADSRNVGYQTLLKMFVQERLYEEEKREGVLSAGVTQEDRTTRQTASSQYDADSWRHALASLDLEKREALWLYFHEGLLLEDVSIRLGLSLGAAHRLLKSGIQELKEELRESGAEPEDEASIRAVLSAL